MFVEVIKELGVIFLVVEMDGIFGLGFKEILVNDVNFVWWVNMGWIIDLY